MTVVQSSRDVRDGVDALLDRYAGLSERDHCVVVFTPDSREAAAWLVAGLKQRRLSARLIGMRPLVDHGFAARLNAAVPDPGTFDGRLVIFTLERDTMSHFAQLQHVLRQFGDDRCMVVRVISASREFFELALNLGPDELSARNAALLTRLTGARSVRVRSRGGTDLRIRLDNERYDWISNRGVWRPGGFTILPAGEIATYPAAIDGRLVADGALNCNVITRIDTRLAARPLTVDIADGRATGFTGGDDDVRELVELCFKQPHGTRVGELGFGTNTGIDRFIPANSHLNERRVGVHIGFGQHNQDRAVVGYEEKVHLDLITDGAELWIDDDPEPVDLANLQPNGEEHPTLVRDEDITGDCCGFGYGELTDPAAATPAAASAND
ncbi:hypothetical protein GCM10018785_11230 [Streptomyces longispororuber]|uniref:Leucyl aminopeptidase (Aminopeptidase T) n=1 Tax=Streptomyces longispororuber TaxID=68230 RepID=A0A918ZBM4_9ACTN|nr:hypothetical protein [Streptomyces longispororuber]GHE43442.1 hypothetical protein GCM10018785_11230 [Streptomyces longispororuber]